MADVGRGVVGAVFEVNEDTHVRRQFGQNGIPRIRPNFAPHPTLQIQSIRQGCCHYIKDRHLSLVAIFLPLSPQAPIGLIEVVAVRDRSMPEVPMMASREAGNREEISIEVADMLALDHEGRASLVIDWKSDVAPTPETIQCRRDQVRSYPEATSTAVRLIVFLSSGVIERVTAAAAR